MGTVEIASRYRGVAEGSLVLTGAAPLVATQRSYSRLALVSPAGTSQRQELTLVNRHLRRLEVADYANFVIDAALQVGFADAKPFALVEGINQGREFHVQGPDWKWVLTSVESFAGWVPPLALEALSWVRVQGISVSGMWVAAPAEYAPSVRTPGPLLSKLTANMFLAGSRRTWAGTKVAGRVAGEVAPLAALGMMAVALVPLMVLAAALGNDPVLVAGINTTPGGPRTNTTVLVELARWA